MTINYDKLFRYIDSKGVSVNALVREKVITDDAAKKIRAGHSVNLYHIDSICQYLKLPIEQVVEIKLDEEPDDQSN